MFNVAPLSEDFKIDENDFVHGLPKIMLGWLHLAEEVMKNPPKPENFNKSVEEVTEHENFFASSPLSVSSYSKDALVTFLGIYELACFFKPFGFVQPTHHELLVHLFGFFVDQENQSQILPLTSLHCVHESF